MFKLTENFINDYKGKQPNWGFGDFSYVIYKRTYAREVENRTEEYWETCKRVVEGTFEIQRRHIQIMGTRWNAHKAQKSAQEMFKLMWEFKFLPPGRGLWAMGSPIVMERGNFAPLLNCAFCSTKLVDVDFPEPFCFLFEASAHGIGVGFDTKGEGKVKIVEPTVGSDTFIVEDSREGWSDLLRRILMAYWGKETLPMAIDYSQVRPFGSTIKTMGGTASGPDALRELIEGDIPTILTPGMLTTTQIVDLMNVIGKCVVAGGTRRSSEIAIGEVDDGDFINLKRDKEKLMAYRWASNNSLSVPPNYNGFDKFVDAVTDNGEPGFVFLDNAKRYARMSDPPNGKDSRVEGVNPCGEQTLEDRECCLLVETFPANCENLEEFKRVLKYAYLYAKTITLGKTPWPKTNEIMLRNRRIGLSQSGILQNIEKIGFAEHIKWCREGYEYLTTLDHTYSEWLCVRESIKRTTVKPSGCQVGHTLVSTDQGILRLDELGDIDGETWQNHSIRVSQETSSEISTKFFIHGMDKTKKISLSSGLNLECSYAHKYRILEDGKYLWKKAEDLKVGDKLPYRIGGYENREDYKFPELEWPRSKVTGKILNFRKFQMPKVLTSDLAWFIGFYFADGSNHALGIRISGSVNKEDSLIRAKSILENLGLRPLLYREEGKRETLYLNNKGFLWWLENVGLSKQYSHEVQIPRQIRESSRESIQSFIEGFKAGDGCKKGGEDSFVTTSANFAKEMVVLMRLVGIDAKMREMSPTDSSWGSRMRYWVSERKGRFNRPSWRYIQGEIKEVWETLDSLGLTELSFDTIVSIEESENILYDLEVPKNNTYLSNTVISHNSVSLLAGATPGIHYPHSEYYIRRVRFTKGSSILGRLEKAGYEMEDDSYDKNVIVVSFPIKERYFTRGKTDVSMWEQLENAAQMQAHWSDNAVSITVGIQEKEFNQVAEALSRYQSRLKSVSFLPLKSHAYVQAPYEEISKERYEEMRGKIRKVNLNKSEHEITEKFCDSDVCMV